jgi:hypothetical protein
VNLLNGGLPVPLREIPSGAYVQVNRVRWRQLKSWKALGGERFQVRWAGSEAYPSTYLTEPSWPVKVAPEPPRTAGGAS